MDNHVINSLLCNRKKGTTLCLNTSWLPQEKASLYLSASCKLSILGVLLATQYLSCKFIGSCNIHRACLSGRAISIVQVYRVVQYPSCMSIGSRHIYRANLSGHAIPILYLSG